MSLSDDQEHCSICKYHGNCCLDADGCAPCERVKNMSQCTCPDGELRLDCPEHYQEAFEVLCEKDPYWASYIKTLTKLHDISLYEAILFTKDQNHFEG